MAFYKITYNEKYRFATLHNYGCTFRCPVCSYKLRSGSEGKSGFAYPAPTGFLSIAEIEQTLSSVDIDTVYFMGGEPTVAKELPEILEYAKKQFGLRTYLGHTNGNKLSLEYLDGANVGIKAWDADLHKNYTGVDKDVIYTNFEKAFGRGLELKANVVFIPSFVDIDQIEQIAIWLSSMSSEIAFHIMGYILVPGQSYASPNSAQMAEAVEMCRKHLKNVKSSSLTSEQALSLSSRDDRFDVRVIADAG